MRSVRSAAIALGGHPKPASRGHLKTGQLQAASQNICFYLSRGRNRKLLSRSGARAVCSLGRSSSRDGCFGAPTAWSTFEDVTMMKKAVEHGCDSRHIAEQLTPVLDGTV